ncbi:ArnT family glycosyltransferase [Pedobacter sp. MW01-1-1]|uniref:ArnT family glycosyltransferase n=1 Tax=Pedobacter sp. MW01-1-1 TaxID=3383027 RepID=UPI003FEF12DC
MKILSVPGKAPFVLFFSLFVIFLLFRIWILGTSTFDIGGIEQNVIYSIQTYLNSGKLYNDPATAPFSITQYTPLFYYLCAITAKVISSSASDNYHLLYTIARSWNIIFNILTAYILFRIARIYFKIELNKAYFLFLLSFTLNSLLNYAARPDSLCDFLMLLSIYYFFMYLKGKKDEKKSLSLLFIVVFLSAAAVFAKQSGVQLIIILGGFCFLNRDWRSFIYLIVFSIICYGAFLFLFISNYPSFLANTVGGISNGIDLHWFTSFILTRPIFIVSYLPIILVSLFFLVNNRFYVNGTMPEKFLALCLLGMVIFATGTGLKMGSGVNYYMLYINIALLLILYNTNRVYGPMVFMMNLFLFFLFTLNFLYAGYHFWVINKLNTKPEYIAQREATIKVAEFLRNDGLEKSGKYVFANLTTNAVIPSRQGLNNMLYKYCLVPNMDVLEVSTGPSKVIGYENLENMLNNGQVEYLIESNPETPFLTILQNLKAIRTAKFEKIKEIDGYIIYKYKTL